MKTIIFFDGVCHLCNGFVDALIQLDSPNRTLHFAPLQGETAKANLSPEDRKQLSTVVLLHQGKTFRRSEAIIKSLALIGGPFKLWTLALVIPAPLRDILYNVIARNRYSWFGEKDMCRFPKAEEKDYLLP